MATGDKPEEGPTPFGSMFGALDQMAAVVSALTGMKKQFVDQGWSDRGAEEMVHAILSQAGNGRRR